MKRRKRTTSAWILAAGITLTALGANAAVNVGSSSWVWQNPYPQADNLNAVSCPTANVCYAVGELGTILVTTSGGSTWSGQNSTTNVTLRGVSCPSTTTCVAVGDAGTILFTNNSGAAWSKQNAFNTSAQLTGVSCPSTSICFAVGPSGVWGTLSLGASWRQLVPNAGFTAISCPSASLGFPCYVAGHTTVAQLRGLPVFGNWRFYLSDTAAVPPLNGATIGLVAISCPTSSTCAAVSYGESLFGANIIGTANGGSSWTSVVLGGVLLESVSCVNSISGSGAPLCYAVGYKVGGAGENEVFIGNPGSASWTSVSAGDTLFNSAPRTLNGVSCSPALIGSVTTGMCFAVGTLGTIVTDTPSGFIWSSRQSSIGESSDPLRPLNGVSCPQPGTCFAVDNFGFYGSVNGGAWVLKNATVGGNSISCPSATACFVGGGNEIMATTNGGLSWIQQLPSADFPDTISSLSCPSTQVCAATGAGSIYFTINGNTWTRDIALASSSGKTVITCPTTTTCIAFWFVTQGQQAVVATTTDLGPSGGHWTISFPPSSNPIQSASCETATHCIAVGNTNTSSPGTFLDGRLITSTNTWSWSVLTPPTQVGDSFSSVSCFLPNSNGLCYAGTFGGEILSYTQVFGGPLFNVEAAISPTIPIQGISCAGTSNYECAIVGYEEAILTKTVGSVGTGVLTPSHGSSEAGDPTTFTLDWTVPSPQVWRDLQYVDLKLVDHEGQVGLWARFIQGNPTSVFALLDSHGNVVSEGAPGTPGVLDSPTATLDLSQSSFQGTGPTGPAVTVNFVVSFKPEAAGNGVSQNATHVYDVEISAADLSGVVQSPENVGSWAVRADH